jgi:hypothetical protein
MKTESTVRPATVERYPGLVRINYDVKEKVPVDVPVLSEESEQVRADVQMYEYRMVEIRGDVPTYDKLTELLVTDKYPTSVLLTLLSDGSATELEEFKQFRFLCKQVAAAVLGLPETEVMQQEKRVMEIEAIDARTDAKILSGYQWTVLHGADAGKTVNVWLSAENQNNYKAKHDVALAYPQLVTFPMRYKISEDEQKRAIYEEFQDINELATFYLGGIAYIERCIDEGWEEKDKVEFPLGEPTGTVSEEGGE